MTKHMAPIDLARWKLPGLPDSPTRWTRRESIQLLTLLLAGSAAGCGPTGDAAEEATEKGSDAGAVAPFERNGVRAAPGLPEPRLIATNGVEIGVYDTGGDGVPIVFSHGFPELAYSWRYQIRALEAAGYRAIAPDQRGYGLSDRPESIDDYTLVDLCADMVGILDALEIERAVFCGHDWGGGVVWMMPRMYPDRVAGVIGLNTPASDPRPENRQPPRESLIIRSENYYSVTFQEPGRAEGVLSADVRRAFEFFLRRGGIWDREAFAQMPEDSPERQMDLLRLVQDAEPSGSLFLPPEELDYFVETFEATGFAGGLNWYRAAGKMQEAVAAAGIELHWDIEVPCLYIGATNDVILPPSSADGMEQFIADLEKYTVEDSGHWTQQEQPEEVNEVILDWLGRKLQNA